VIIATGYADMIANADFATARIDDVIRKPYAVADVLARANAVLAVPQDASRETVRVQVSGALSSLTLSRVAVNDERRRIAAPVAIHA
jgi:DNA-binding response OmpR family regulator